MAELDSVTTGVAVRGSQCDRPDMMWVNALESAAVTPESRFAEVFPRQPEAMTMTPALAKDNDCGDWLPVIEREPYAPITGGPPPPVQEQQGFRRHEICAPITPSPYLSDELLYEDPFGGQPYALCRYAPQYDRIGSVDEPRVVIADRGGVPHLSLTLAATPGPRSGPGVREMPHSVSVTLKMTQPVVGGSPIMQAYACPVVRLEAGGIRVVAELPLSTPELRQQLLAALGSPAAEVAVVVSRGIYISRETSDRFADKSNVWLEYGRTLDWTCPPSPLVLSERQLARLGGGSGGVDPARRVRVEFEGRSHAYWQDPARPDLFLHLPDRFLLARSPEGARPPLMRVSAVDAVSEEDLATVLEFAAKPVVDPRRLTAALPALAVEARAMGGTGQVRLGRLLEVQSLLRLALPVNGAPSPALTDRPGTEIDLERGIVHAERFLLEDFRLVYDALFGASLSLLRGEIRVGANSASPEDVPLELRLDRTIGDVLLLQPHPITQPFIQARLTNMIESPVVLTGLRAATVSPGASVQLTVSGLPADGRLAPRTSCELVLTPVGGASLPPTVDGVALDQSQVVVEPNRAAVWEAVFDRTTDGRLLRQVEARAVADMFAAADRPTDRVSAFVLTIENGGSASLTEAQLSAMTTVRVPVQPLLTGAPLPPVRYRTETHWRSGGIGVSPWRETDAVILFPVRTPPA